MSAHWQIGMEVECVDDSADAHGRRLLVAGDVYKLSTAGGAYIGLVGLPNGLYRASRFRPVQKRTTSIECFRALLNPTEQDKEEIELAEFILSHSEGLR